MDGGPDALRRCKRWPDASNALKGRDSNKDCPLFVSDFAIKPVYSVRVFTKKPEHKAKLAQIGRNYVGNKTTFIFGATTETYQLVPKGVRHVSEVTSISVYLNQTPDGDPTNLNQAVNARRGGFLKGTKVATTSGWKPVERIAVGDLIRTLDHGFKGVRRISTNVVVIPADERRDEYLPVFVPARAAFNGRPVWLMPEQGMALTLSKIDAERDGVSVVPARVLSGAGRLMSQAPGSSFEVCSLFFDEDQVIFVEGGLQAYCPSGRFSMRGSLHRQSYEVADDVAAADLANSIAIKGDMSALANPLGALPAPIPQDPIFPIRPPSGVRRPGRPGRPNAPVLFLRPEWQI